MTQFVRLLRNILGFAVIIASGAACAQFDVAAPAQSASVEAATVSVADPQSRARIHTELGALYFQAGSPAVALEHLAMALQISPNFYQANNVRALVYASLRENAKAEADFARALSRAPNDPEVNNNYGWFLCDTGRERASIPHFDRALRDPLYETPDRAYTNAGSCLLKLGDLDEAQSYLLQAVRVSRSGAVPARLALAKLFFKRGILEEARLYLNDALRMMEPPTAEALWLGVRLERRLGNKRAEDGFAAQLRSRYPTSTEYQEFLKGNFE